MKKLAYTLLFTTGLACFSNQSFAQQSDEFIQTEQLAEQGNPDAQFNLGVMYDEGYGVEKDQFKAVEWYTKAANQGYAKAQSNLGFMYAQGKGTPLDYKKATEWFTKAADQGYGEAYYNLGMMYGQGDGVPKNLKKAKEYIKQGCLHKDQDSCDVYAKLSK